MDLNLFLRVHTKADLFTFFLVNILKITTHTTSLFDNQYFSCFVFHPLSFQYIFDTLSQLHWQLMNGIVVLVENKFELIKFT